MSRPRTAFIEMLVGEHVVKKIEQAFQRYEELLGPYRNESMTGDQVVEAWRVLDVDDGLRDAILFRCCIPGARRASTRVRRGGHGPSGGGHPRRRRRPALARPRPSESARRTRDPGVQGADWDDAQARRPPDGAF